jgi:hypothetical protein
VPFLLCLGAQQHRILDVAINADTFVWNVLLCFAKIVLL